MKTFVAEISAPTASASKQVTALHTLHSLLKSTGRSTLTATSVGNGMNEYSYAYQSDGTVSPFASYSGSGDFSFTYNEKTNKWDANGVLFGINPSGNDPKSFFMQVLHGVRAISDIQNGFFTKAMTLWERYRGDLEQFTYRLSIDLAAVGTMERLTDEMRPLKFRWHTIEQSKEFVVWFSTDSKPTPLGAERKFYIGFNENAATHVYELSMPILSELRDRVLMHNQQVATFCEDSSAVFTHGPT
jgi:hypothetical protein